MDRKMKWKETIEYVSMHKLSKRTNLESGLKKVLRATINGSQQIDMSTVIKHPSIIGLPTKAMQFKFYLSPNSLQSYPYSSHQSNTPHLQKGAAHTHTYKCYARKLTTNNFTLRTVTTYRTRSTMKYTTAQKTAQMGSTKRTMNWVCSCLRFGPQMAVDLCIAP